jgi:hypothetical protein
MDSHQLTRSFLTRLIFDPEDEVISFSETSAHTRRYIEEDENLSTLLSIVKISIRHAVA